jgi:hypothetical protein
LNTSVETTMSEKSVDEDKVGMCACVRVCVCACAREVVQMAWRTPLLAAHNETSTAFNFSFC